MILSEKGSWEIEQIGIIYSCYAEKFGIPRQPGLVDKARANLVLKEPFNRREMVKELSRFSHLWIIFLFHESIGEGWKHTVRPPGLGGKQRVGVFASRSPHRPNHIGFSAVRLVHIFFDDNQVSLELEGGDFLDQTPVIDIKPYISYSDSITNSTGGYTGLKKPKIEIQFSRGAEKFCGDYCDATGRDLQGLIYQVLSQDPRPASQRRKEKDFGVQLWDVNIRWHAKGEKFMVFECRETHGAV